MSSLISRNSLGLALFFLGLAGCSSQPAVYEHENFDDSGTFSRNYSISDTAACEAARRALLSQGYIITNNDPKLVSGRKSFQQTGETHMEISFNVVCVANGATGSTMFANALQDRYALKKINNSASLGVGVLGSVSMPIGSTSDSMVKVASETVTADKFYDRYFILVESFLPPHIKQSAHLLEKPKGDLSLPEAKAQTPAPAAATVQPEPATFQAPPDEIGFSSVPLAPPPEAAPLITTDTALPAEAENLVSDDTAQQPAELAAPSPPTALP
ncbi:DUF2242 domain-containing protein [Pseudomonas duriflava]|nr:DUF2242 domain-containing protein [Pseudomonas duriflava]